MNVFVSITETCTRHGVRETYVSLRNQDPDGQPGDILAQYPPFSVTRLHMHLYANGEMNGITLGYQDPDKLRAALEAHYEYYGQAVPPEFAPVIDEMDRAIEAAKQAPLPASAATGDDGHRTGQYL